jgi:class 3 adenylate cyclase
VEAAAQRGLTNPLALRFVDPQLEADYQRTGGREGRVGYLIATGSSALLWAVAAVLLPRATAASTLTAGDALPLAVAMSVTSFAFALAAPSASTLDRQHGLLAVLTSANGLVIMALGTMVGFFAGYAVAALMLLFVFGFVSRTGFIYALGRTAIIAAGFAYFVATSPENLLLDVFIFATAAVGTLVALRMMERARRNVFYQQQVIGRQAAELALEKDKSDQLLLNVLPATIVPRLIAGETAIADDYPSVSVLFADIVAFTPLSHSASAKQIVALLDDVFGAFDQLAAERRIEKIKTIGDAYMAAAGLTEPGSDHALKMVDLGLAMIELATARTTDWGDLRLRIGVHTGPAAGGVIGRQKFAFDLWGDTINIASRLEQQGLPGQVHISEETWLLVRDKFAADLRGENELRGVGERRTYLVVGRKALSQSWPAAHDESVTGA